MEPHAREVQEVVHTIDHDKTETKRAEKEEMDQSKIESIVTKIIALRRLTAETGFKTTRSQNAIFLTLTPEELGEVAQFLASEDAQVALRTWDKAIPEKYLH